ncbi:MAG: HAD family hydrolase [Promethearchaeota archaeon]
MNDTTKSYPTIILFDFDGVLFNLKGAILSIRQAMLDPFFEWNYDELKKYNPKDLIKRFETCDSPSNFHSVKEIYKIFRDILPVRNKRIRFFFSIYRNLRQFEEKHGDFFEGVGNVLEKLHKAGFILGICTNSRSKKVKYWLKRKKYDKYITAYCTRDDKNLYGLKPDPRPLLGLLIKLKRKLCISSIRKKMVYFIGDSASKDLIAAQKAHVKSVAVLSGLGSYQELSILKPDFILNSVSELFTIQEINAKITH